MRITYRALTLSFIIVLLPVISAAKIDSSANNLSDSSLTTERTSKKTVQPDTLPAPIKSVELDQIEIKQNRFTFRFAEAARNMAVIRPAERNDLPSIGLAELLGTVSGVDIRRRNPVGIQADIGIMGGTFEQTQVLLNGIKMSDPQTGHHMMNLPVNLQEISQIQVLKGPGARIYGQNAFTGAVNIITEIPPERGLRLFGYGGAFDSFGGRASISIPSGELRQLISLSHDLSDGYRHNTDYELTNLYYQGELSAGPGRFELLAGYSDRSFGANSFYASEDFEDQWETVQTSILSFDYRAEGDNWELTPRIYWRRNDDEYRLIRHQPEIFQNFHTTNVLSAETHSVVRHRYGRTGLGVEVRNESIESSNLGNHNRDHFGFYAEHRIEPTPRFDLTPGVYVNWYSDYDWNAFPGIDLRLALAERWHLFANAGLSYRIPTYTDLYYEGPTNIGNPDLEPEQAITWEAGLRYLSSSWMAHVSFFRRHADRLIDWVRESSDDPWQPRNFHEVTTTGLDLQFELAAARIAGIPYLERLHAGFTILDSNILNNGDLESQYTLSHLRYQMTAGFTWAPYSRMHHSVTWRYTDRLTLDSYHLIDSRLHWMQSGWGVFIEAVNLTDTEYREVNLVPMPGRWLRAGINLELGF